MLLECSDPSLLPKAVADVKILIASTKDVKTESALSPFVLLPLEGGGGSSEPIDSSSKRELGDDDELDGALAFFGGGSPLPSSSAPSRSWSVGGSPSAT